MQVSRPEGTRRMSSISITMEIPATKERCGGLGRMFMDMASGITVYVETATETGFIVTIENKFVELGAVAISGPVEGTPGEVYTFTADILPITASEPITYVWEATDQLPITHTEKSAMRCPIHGWMRGPSRSR